ncbi:MAG: hypothetical protein AVDCRST_MAG88-3673, partial [uncultured Thermomicrobiales bacterium]
GRLSQRHRTTGAHTRLLPVRRGRAASGRARDEFRRHPRGAALHGAVCPAPLRLPVDRRRGDRAPLGDAGARVARARLARPRGAHLVADAPCPSLELSGAGVGRDRRAPALHRAGPARPAGL